MVPVDQTIFEKGRGNCFAACLASILECEITDVQNFPDGVAYDWRRIINEWLAPLKLHYIDMLLNGDGRDELSAFWGYHIISGISPRDNKINHAVVGFNGEIVFDPHPSRDGLIGDEEDFSYGFLISTHCKEK